MGWNRPHTSDDWDVAYKASREAQQDLTPAKKGLQPSSSRTRSRRCRKLCAIKGHYRGKIDGVFGLRTRASLRAYQKAENLPVTGQVDTRTADGLGVRPESTWGNSNSAGREVGHNSDRAAGEMKRDKPSAGIRRAAGRAQQDFAEGSLTGHCYSKTTAETALTNNQLRTKKHDQ